MLHFIHLVDLAVAVDAGDPAADMDGVVEIDVIRRFVDLDPRDGLAGVEGLPDELQFRGILGHGRMAIHARGGCRDVGEPRLVDGVVAITTVNAQLVGVNGVRKRHGLLGLIAHP